MMVMACLAIATIMKNSAGDGEAGKNGITRDVCVPETHTNCGDNGNGLPSDCDDYDYFCEGTESGTQTNATTLEIRTAALMLMAYLAHAMISNISAARAKLATHGVPHNCGRL